MDRIIHSLPTERLEAAIGYRFADPSLLRLALTHSSHSNETGERNQIGRAHV